MRRRMAGNGVMGVAAVVCLAGCASTRFVSSGKAPDAQPVSFQGQKVAALVMAPNESTRLGAEGVLTRELTQRGMIGVPAYNLIPPLSISVIAAQQGLIASPVSAVTAALMVALAGSAGLPQILLVVIPASLVGLAAGTLSVAFRGKDLADDPEYQERLAQGKLTSPAARAEQAGAASRPAIISCAVFAAAIAAVVLIGIFPGLRPLYEQVGEGVTETGQVEMGQATMIVMLAAAGLILLLARSDPEKAIKGSVMKGGLTAIISILGVSWMGSSFFEGNRAAIVGAISATLETHPWVFAAGLFVLSILLFSQAATIAILGPVAVALGLPAPLIVGAYPAVNGNFFLPTYGTVLAAVSFDQTGGSGAISSITASCARGW